MKIRQLNYISRMVIPFIELMKHHPRVLKTKTEILQDKVTCEMTISPKNIGSSFMFKAPIKTVFCEIDKDNLRALLGEDLNSVYATGRIKRLVEKVTICKEFSIDEIVDFVSNHPHYAAYDDDMRKWEDRPRNNVSPK